MTTEIKLIESSNRATCCVILPSGFANCGNFVFFHALKDARKFVRENGGRIVDEDGLAEKFRAMHMAEGQVRNQSYSGRYVNTPDDADDDWMESFWNQEYASLAAEEFKEAQVFEIE